MNGIVFESRPLPATLADEIRTRLAQAHAREPFSPVEPRAAVRRVEHLLADLDLQPTVYRGELSVRGVGVDHLWLEIPAAGSGAPGGRGYVLDAAFPLFVEAFVRVLRRFVAGDAEPADLIAAAAAAGVDARVMGEFPRSARYFGAPLWGERG